jgi:hypothetical protein
MSTREREVQQERRRIFFDLAADIFYQQFNYVRTVKKEEEEGPPQKKRKVQTPDEELLTRIVPSQTNSDDTVKHWLLMLSSLVYKHTQLPKEFLNQLLTPLKEAMEAIQSAEVHSIILKILKQLAFLTNSENIKFWEQDLWPLLCKNVSTEASQVIRPTLALMSVYFKPCNAAKGFGYEKLLLESTYFTDPKECSQ